MSRRQDIAIAASVAGWLCVAVGLLLMAFESTTFAGAYTVLAGTLLVIAASLI